MQNFFGWPFWVGLILGWLILGKVIDYFRSKVGGMAA